MLTLHSMSTSISVLHLTSIQVKEETYFSYVVTVDVA